VKARIIAVVALMGMAVSFGGVARAGSCPPEFAFGCSISGQSSGAGLKIQNTRTSVVFGTTPSGIWGDQSGFGNGVMGTSASGNGVSGQSNSGVGVFGSSTSNSGVYGRAGSGASGVYGENTGGGTAVTGRSSGTGMLGDSTGAGIGMKGTSATGVGVRGESRGAVPSAGVYGSSANGYGVMGDSVASYGVLGVSANNAGVRGQSTNNNGVMGSSDSGVGVYGSSISGYAGRFDGRVRVNTLEIVGGADLAEPFDVAGSPSGARPAPGMLVCIDPKNPGKLAVCASEYDSTVAGAISGAGGVQPGMIMRQDGSQASGLHPVALTGRVYVWADANAHPIKPGDLLTTSVTAGHAAKVVDHDRAQGAVIGKAMGSLERGQGLVLVLVSLN
jgi:hypothetical protein